MGTLGDVMTGDGRRATPTKRTLVCLAAVVGLFASGLLPRAHADDHVAPEDQSSAVCGPDDVPEPGMQGEAPAGQTPAWNCGISKVGFLPDAGGTMAVAGTCAYTGGGAGADFEESGVRVIDVSDPANPRLVRVLDTGSRELLAAKITDERGILVTRGHRDKQQQEGQVLGRDLLVDVWDIFEDCTNPVHLGVLRFPTRHPVEGDPGGPDLVGPAHNLALNPTATKVYGSIPPHVGDITNLDDPDSWKVRDLYCELTKQHYEPHQLVPAVCEQNLSNAPFTGPNIDHEPVFNPEGTRLYMGGQDTNVPSVPGWVSGATFWIVDITGPDPKVVSVTDGAAGHSIDYATIDGRDYVLHSNEIGSGGCVPEELRVRGIGMSDRVWMTDITDETAPQEVSETMLAVSRFENCNPTNPTGGPSTAYHDIDDSLESTYAVINFGSAGLRAFDIRDPQNPVEVAYFNHGEPEHTKPYIIPETGHIWMSGAGGFWVLELQPEVRERLDLADGPNNRAPGARRPGAGKPETPGKPVAPARPG